MNAIHVTPDHTLWPRQFDGALTEHLPSDLWVSGERLDILEEGMEMVTIMGTRVPSQYGTHVTHDLADQLGQMGIATCTVSQKGIGEAVLQCAVSAGHPFVMVTPGGPMGRFARDIAPRGLVVSPYPPGTPHTRARWAASNRLSAMLSDALVFVEGRTAEGYQTMVGGESTASLVDFARTAGVPIGAVPGPVTSSLSSGPHDLLRNGDARCVTSAHDIRALAKAWMSEL